MDVLDMKCEQREAFVDGKMCGGIALYWSHHVTHAHPFAARRRLFFMEGVLMGEAPGGKAFAASLKALQGAL